MRRKAKRKWQLVTAALVLLAGTGLWSSRDTFATARIGTTYVAKQNCSCLFVAERPFESCRADFDPEAVRAIDVVVDRAETGRRPAVSDLHRYRSGARRFQCAGFRGPIHAGGAVEGYGDRAVGIDAGAGATHRRFERLAGARGSHIPGASELTRINSANRSIDLQRRLNRTEGA